MIKLKTRYFQAVQIGKNIRKYISFVHTPLCGWLLPCDVKFNENLWSGISSFEVKNNNRQCIDALLNS